MSGKFKIGTEFELEGEHFVVTHIDSHWISYRYKDGREERLDEYLAFMPMSDDALNSKIL